ncbi:hypothetical protein N510_001659 [Firmicutes bacterium ASF500]|nr:hypothetical protein N510_001659 [Firmicutes bacterium ASF500]
MIRLNPQVFSNLYGKDLIAFGTGNMAKRIIPYLAQDPNIRLCGVTSSRVTADDEGTFLKTGLQVRSIEAWAGLMPNATILLTVFVDSSEIVQVCKNAGFQNVEYITWEQMSLVSEAEAEIAQAQQTKLLEQLCFVNELHDTHKSSFSEFKGCNRGKTVAIIGTGPTLNYYTQLTGVPHIGVNSSFLKEGIMLDYYFLTHYVPEWCEKLKEFNFTKFFNVGIKSRKKKDQIPEYIIEENDGRRYFSLPMMPFTHIHTNLECYPLMGYGSIIFQAIHFALFTHPQKLLLVGCDCAAIGHFDSCHTSVYVEKFLIPWWIDGYKKLRRFVSIHYPDIEIISVNPVGLKGMFCDMFTENYLDTHPELPREDCKILRL